LKKLNGEMLSGKVPKKAAAEQAKAVWVKRRKAAGKKS
jgi:hypothetical protein